MSLDFTRIHYFKPEEFVEPDKLRWSMLEKLDQLRDRCDFPFIITSSYRSPEHNATVPGAASDSTHMANKDGEYSGIDFCTHAGAQITPRELYWILKHAFEIGFTRVGLYRDMLHVHLDDDPYHDQEVVWIK